MSLSLFNPTRDLMSLREAMNRLLDESFAQGTEADFPAGRMAPLPVDVYSTENEFVVTAAVPGVDSEKVNITVEGDALTITGEMLPRPENVDYIFSERFHGRFIRTLQLNTPIDTDKITADFENGILTVTLPKAEAAKPKQIQIKTR